VLFALDPRCCCNQGCNNRFPALIILYYWSGAWLMDDGVSNAMK
jgi:hypothetical protein